MAKYSNGEYEKEVSRTMNSGNPISAANAEVLNYVIGMIGEAGEVADLLKKHIFHGHAINRDELISEIGDVEWYLTAIKILCKISSEETMASNVAKLRKRYKNGFTEEESQHRKEYKEG